MDSKTPIDIQLARSQKSNNSNNRPNSEGKISTATEQASSSRRSKDSLQNRMFQEKLRKFMNASKNAVDAQKNDTTSIKIMQQLATMQTEKGVMIEGMQNYLFNMQGV